MTAKKVSGEVANGGGLSKVLNGCEKILKNGMSLSKKPAILKASNAGFRTVRVWLDHVFGGDRWT